MKKFLNKSILNTFFVVGLCLFLGSGCASFNRQSSGNVFLPNENYYSALLSKSDVSFVVKSAYTQIKKIYSPLKTRFNMVKTKENDKFGVLLKGLLTKSGYAIYEVAELSALKGKQQTNLKSAISGVSSYNLTYSLDSAGSGIFYLVIKIHSVNNEKLEVYNCPFLLEKGKWSQMGFWSVSTFGEYELEKAGWADKTKDNLNAINEGIFNNAN